VFAERGIEATLDGTVPPGLWQRYLALILDGLRCLRRRSRPSR